MPTQKLHGPIQLLKQDETTKKFVLNETELYNILDQEDVRDCYLSIVSICGAFRKGKSFMLGFFLRYLESMYTDNENINWLGQGTEALQGFEWKGGSKRNTTGIWIWSKIFTKTLPNGEKIGVMLMDTQGTFDSSSTMHDNVTIFTLATMLSSVQIYNIFSNIQEDNLQHLQLFTEYGKLAMENSKMTPFQKMIFLVRDWQWPHEEAYGFDGGKQLLDEFFQITNNQAAELVDIRKHIKSCFEHIECFLMPHPGQAAAGKPDFKGNLNDIDPLFVEQTNVFVSTILNKNMLPLKKFNGQKVQAKNVFQYIKTYWNLFSGDKIPPANTILVATATANSLSAKSDAFEYYNERMDDYTSSKEYIEFGEMIAISNAAKLAAIDLFNKKAVMGSAELRRSHEVKLEKHITSQSLFHLGRNEGKRTKDLTQMIENLQNEMKVYCEKNSEQSGLIAELTKQLQDFEKKSAKEKEILRQKIEELENDKIKRNKSVCAIQ